jgi:surfeit locus 1 family protein
MLAVVVATVLLGNWQFRRAEYKAALATQHSRAQEEPPVELTPATEYPETLRYRRVRVRGEFVAGSQMLLDNRVYEGRVGYHVLTVMRLPQGAFVLVNRGWVALGVDRSRPPAPPVPPGTVVLDGRIAFPASARAGESVRAEAGGVWQRIDLTAMGEAAGLALLPLVVEQTRPLGPDDRLGRNWPAPDFGVEKHRSYTVQWYSLALLAVVLWLVLNLAKRRDRDGQG